MDVYKEIKKNIKQDLIDNDNNKLARISGKVIDIYIDKLLRNLFTYGIIRIRSIRSYFYINIKPLAYITSGMYKNMLISNLNSNYLFEIKMKSDYVTKNKFTFKSLNKLKYFFKKHTLDNERVYTLIQNYEKSIL